MPLLRSKLALLGLVGMMSILPASYVWSADSQDLENASFPALDALLDFAAELDSLSARFTQTTREPGGFVLDRLEGTFSYRAPIQFRFAYTSPVEEVIVGDGDRVWHYDPSLGQATARAQSSLGDSPVLLLTNPSLLRDAYEIAPGEDESIISLYPRADDTGLIQVQIVMVDEQPRLIVWEDDFGQITELELSSIETNPVLESSLFVFDVPEGVDVLEGL